MIGLFIVMSFSAGAFGAAYRSMESLAQFQIEARVAQTKTEMNETRLREIEKVLKETQKNLQQEMEFRIIAETKIGMITGEWPVERQKKMVFNFFGKKESSQEIQDSKSLPLATSRI